MVSIGHSFILSVTITLFGAYATPTHLLFARYAVATQPPGTTQASSMKMRTFEYLESLPLAPPLLPTRTPARIRLVSSEASFARRSSFDTGDAFDEPDRESQSDSILSEFGIGGGEPTLEPASVEPASVAPPSPTPPRPPSPITPRPPGNSHGSAPPASSAHAPSGTATSQTRTPQTHGTQAGAPTPTPPRSRKTRKRPAATDASPSPPPSPPPSSMLSADLIVYSTTLTTLTTPSAQPAPPQLAPRHINPWIIVGCVLGGVLILLLLLPLPVFLARRRRRARGGAPAADGARAALRGRLRGLVRGAAAKRTSADAPASGGSARGFVRIGGEKADVWHGAPGPAGPLARYATSDSRLTATLLGGGSDMCEEPWSVSSVLNARASSTFFGDEEDAARAKPPFPKDLEAPGASAVDLSVRSGLASSGGDWQSTGRSSPGSCTSRAPLVAGPRPDTVLSCDLSSDSMCHSP